MECYFFQGTEVSMSKKKFKMFIILFFSCLFVISCGPDTKSNYPKKKEEVQMDDKNTLTIHFSADGRLPFDWYASWITNDSFMRAVYGTLTSVTPNGLFYTDDNSILDLVDTNNTDSTKIIFRLKQGLYFKNGEKEIEATAYDLKFSYSIPFFLKNTDIFEKSDLLKIVGMDKILPGGNYSEEKVKGIKILDKYTIEIDLKFPDPNFITNLSTSKYPIVSKFFYLNKGKNSLSPGLGKYQIYSLNQHIGEAILQRKVHLDNFPDFVKFISSDDQRGDILWKDMWGDLDSKFKKETIEVPYGTLGIFFNYNTKLGRNKDFREAINLAINRKILCDSFRYLIPNEQVLPNDYWGRIDVEENQDIQKSKKIIKNIKNIPNVLEIKIFGQSEEEIKKPYFLTLKSQLEQVGLKPKFIVDSGSEDPDTILFISGIAVPYKDPAAVFQFFVDGSFYENGYPKNDFYMKDTLSKLISSSLDKEKLKYAKDLSFHLYLNNYFIPLWDLLSLFNVNTERVLSLGEQPGGMRFDISNVKLKESLE